MQVWLVLGPLTKWESHSGLDSKQSHITVHFKVFFHKFDRSRHKYCSCVFQVSRKDFEGFRNLFQRFLQVKGPSVEWIKIQRPPEDSVCLPSGGVPMPIRLKMLIIIMIKKKCSSVFPHMQKD